MNSEWKKIKDFIKNENRDVRPWDLINPNTEWASEEVASNRFAICKECPLLVKGTNQCRECGCFMVAKTKLQMATCPLHKW